MQIEQRYIMAAVVRQAKKQGILEVSTGLILEYGKRLQQKLNISNINTIVLNHSYDIFSVRKNKNGIFITQKSGVDLSNIVMHDVTLAIIMENTARRLIDYFRKNEEKFR